MDDLRYGTMANLKWVDPESRPGASVPAQLQELYKRKLRKRGQKIRQVRTERLTMS
jgi:hypothetical protein